MRVVYKFDTTDAITDDLHFNFVSRQFGKKSEIASTTLYVCLQDDVHFVNFTSVMLANMFSSLNFC